LSFLSPRRGFLQAVVFSGGEPTFQDDLPQALKAVRALGFETALHTAGPDPKLLSAVLPFLDWVGLDIKAPFDERYDRLTGRPRTAGRVRESLLRLIRSGVAYQLRTTVHPALLSTRDVEEIQASLAALGAAPAVIQPFRSEGCADEELCGWPAPA
jgi:pyruvate formate lyase activating enzyme